jgi:hypothetical protein
MHKTFPDSWTLQAPGDHLFLSGLEGFPESFGGKFLSLQRSLFPPVLQASHEQEKEAFTHSFQEAKAAFQVRRAGQYQSLVWREEAWSPGKSKLMASSYEELGCLPSLYPAP